MKKPALGGLFAEQRRVRREALALILVGRSYLVRGWFVADGLL